MHSWVRYSVAVYVGLLLAGVLVGPVPRDSAGSPGPLPELSDLPPLPLQPVDEPEAPEPQGQPPAGPLPTLRQPCQPAACLLPCLPPPQR